MCIRDSIQTDTQHTTHARACTYNRNVSSIVTCVHLHVCGSKLKTWPEFTRHKKLLRKFASNLFVRVHIESKIGVRQKSRVQQCEVDLLKSCMKLLSFTIHVWLFKRKLLETTRFVLHDKIAEISIILLIISTIPITNIDGIIYYVFFSFLFMFVTYISFIYNKNR